MIVTDKDLAAFEQHGRTATLMVGLEKNTFVQTDEYLKFRDRLFEVVEAREARLNAGKFEQKGAALLGAAGCGKTRMAEEAINEYHALVVASGPRKFGNRIFSAIVPGRATVGETLKAIISALTGTAFAANRNDDYLTDLLVNLMKEAGIVAIHLDEAQDVGRYKTSDSIEVFSKRFRNLTQHREWPICLIITATTEGRALINHDQTLTRRLHPMEIRPITFANDAPILRKTIAGLLHEAEIGDTGLLAQNEFIRILIHAAVGRFGVAIEMAIEAIGECFAAGNDTIDMSYFADAYEMRMGCDDELNPFVAENWKTIDTGQALQRYIEEKHSRRKRLNKA
jgi:hypothetical protein